ncbi:UPAR/Ly6 domain-containing protein crok [Calliopsis andreniformis]|uniref:UPAR/Ly6 domain-containing protein crok n=1 Tax=Calliopsis andreniformis TaxID=337506 RepID=UPI003FCE7352
MSSRFEWMLMIFGLIVLAGSGSALRCWDCASNTNPLCGDPLNVTDHQTTFHTKICDANIYERVKPICRKIVKRENGERVVIRQCSTPNVDEADITDGPCSAMALSGRSVVESCHICSTDLCNSATSLSVVQPLYIAALALISYCFLQTKYNIV